VLNVNEESRILMIAKITPNFAWLLLVAAGLLEIVWAVSMKASHGFTKHLFTAITLVAAGLSFWLLGLALRQLPVGTAYAVWTGIGAVGAAIFGIVFFGESLTVARVGCIALIVCGILGLKFLGGDSAA
jgi:quaternary ammonium compound-resistance protein SugE